jgi:uncharacterized coiled-coil protein SlyX
VKGEIAAVTEEIARLQQLVEDQWILLDRKQSAMYELTWRLEDLRGNDQTELETLRWELEEAQGRLKEARAYDDPNQLQRRIHAIQSQIAQQEAELQAKLDALQHQVFNLEEELRQLYRGREDQTLGSQ